MIFATLSGSSSLREVSSIMLACEGKINHLGLSNYPKRSTLSDANKKRSSSVFAANINPFIISTSIFYRTATQK
jgi:hypothetical protein